MRFAIGRFTTTARSRIGIEAGSTPANGPACSGLGFTSPRLADSFAQLIRAREGLCGEPLLDCDLLQIYFQGCANTQCKSRSGAACAERCSEYAT